MLNLVGEGVGKERKAETGTTDNGQKICAFHLKEQRGDGRCAFMDANGFCNYAQMDKFERVDKERPKTNAGAEAKVAGKLSSGSSGEGE